MSTPENITALKEAINDSGLLNKLERISLQALDKVNEKMPRYKAYLAGQDSTGMSLAEKGYISAFPDEINNFDYESSKAEINNNIPNLASIIANNFADNPKELERTLKKISETTNESDLKTLLTNGGKVGTYGFREKFNGLGLDTKIAEKIISLQSNSKISIFNSISASDINNISTNYQNNLAQAANQNIEEPATAASNSNDNITEETQPQPKAAPTTTATRKQSSTLREGMSGEKVLELQNILIEKGFLADKEVDANGSPIFNANVTSALKDAQAELGFTGKDIDGVYGKNTRARLDAYQPERHTQAQTQENTPTNDQGNTNKEATPPTAAEQEQLSINAFKLAIYQSEGYQELLTEISKNIEAIEAKAKLGRRGLGSEEQQAAAKAFNREDIYTQLNNTIPKTINNLATKHHNKGEKGFEQIAQELSITKGLSVSDKINLLEESLASSSSPEEAKTLADNLRQANEFLGNKFTFFDAFENLDLSQANENLSKINQDIGAQFESGQNADNIISDLNDKISKEQKAKLDKARQDAERIENSNGMLSTLPEFLQKLITTFVSLITGQSGSPLGNLFGTLPKIAHSAKEMGKWGNRADIDEILDANIAGLTLEARDIGIANALGDELTNDIITKGTKGYIATDTEKSQMTDWHNNLLHESYKYASNEINKLNGKAPTEEQKAQIRQGIEDIANNHLKDFPAMEAGEIVDYTKDINLEGVYGGIESDKTNSPSHMNPAAPQAKGQASVVSG